jgi:hypothetical protein
MAGTGSGHRPNVLFSVAGIVLIVAGLCLTVYGLVDAVQVMSGFDPLRGDGPPVRIADGMGLAFWGIIVFTIGRYLWRGARRRGARDRFGRILIIVGYVLLGVGLDLGVHEAVGLWDSEIGDGAQAVVVRTAVLVAIWAIPGAILAAIGFRMASERALTTAEVNAGF